MKQAKHFLALIAVALFTTNAWAQMTFTYSTTATESTLSDGSTLVQLPASTNLNGRFITGATVGGQTVSLDAITPNPATTFITEGEIETFVYDGKAYSFRFLAGEYFTMVIFSDPHVDTEDIQKNVSTKTTAIAAMGTASGKKFTFSKAPSWYVPKADIVFCLGDMDEDKEKDASSPGQYYKDATAAFNTAKIPFITLYGNHDLAPDYYDGDKGDAGLTWGINDGGSYFNDLSIKIVKEHRTQAQDNGISDVNIFKDSDLKCDVQIEPFAFLFKGIRFYVGHTYWFHKPYDKPGMFSSTTYYAADGVIEALDTYVGNHLNEPSIWLQHYPFTSEYNSDNDASARWWLDQSNAGRCIAPKDASSSQYYNNGSVPSYKTSEGVALATKKKKTLADIIVKTTNPVHFSGHSHRNDIINYTASDNKTSFTDYTIRPFTEGSDNAYIVLCKEGVGVVEVQRVTF
jgi:hypothetical protein